MSADIERILAEGSLEELGALLRGSRISAVKIAEWFLTRIEAENCGRFLNAVREVSPLALGHARVAAEELRLGLDRGPLHGIPVLLKDNILVPGMTATAGAKALAGFRPQGEATLAARLRRAGAVILGKTNMTEFADFVSDVMPSEFSGAGGVVRNPHGTAYGRGQGSSVGSAAAVAAGLAPYAIGSETQNSIQSPACHSSVVGLKPSVGRVSRAGMVPLVPSQDSPGPSRAASPTPAWCLRRSRDRTCAIPQRWRAVAFPPPRAWTASAWVSPAGCSPDGPSCSPPSNAACRSSPAQASASSIHATFPAPSS